MTGFSRAVAACRGDSEDRAEVFVREGEVVVVVADGAGGIRGGAAASDAVIDAVRKAPVGFDPRALLRRVDAIVDGETTAVIVTVDELGIHGASCGDSEAWIVTPTSIDDLTVSQNRNRVGSRKASPTLFHRAKSSGILVVATDGLFKYASRERIAATVRIDGAADRLIALVRLPSGDLQDDVAAIALPL